MLCPFCNINAETVYHILVQCSVAHSCWNRSSVHLNAVSEVVFEDWFWHLFEVNLTSNVEEALMICWAIWNARNDLLWNQKSSAAATIVLSARSNLNQWKCAQQRRMEPLTHVAHGVEDERWTKPDINTIKVNVDGAIFQASNSHGFGFIARDCDGIMIEARTSITLGSASPEVAEVIGIKEVLSWLKTKTWPSVIVETDCLVAVQAIHSSVCLPSYFGFLVSDCKNLLDELSNVSLIFVKRTANKAAHFLARSSCYSSVRIFDVTNSPSELTNIVMADSI
ncbi:uncharacterized protein LOC133034579 [Cannabis sativa]|uniref:uncharacterized protein LOC133034579 n=1 Tax=Cannabis sativa TaxID=3483 RepID=UPI0029CA200A|nr:uncharacterized protein LOC133034579 [Cannabis sativa]